MGRFDINTCSDGFDHLQKGFDSNAADWFVNYDADSDVTAIVVCGADGIGVMFICLSGDLTKELKEVAEKYAGFNKGINGELGECIRYACTHGKLLPERCTIGGAFSSQLAFRELPRKKQ